VVLIYIPSSKSACLDCTAKQILVCVHQSLGPFVLGNPLHGSSWEKKGQKQTHSLFGFGNCLKGMYQHPPRGGWHLLLSMWHFLDGPGIYISYNNTVDGRNPVPVDR